MIRELWTATAVVQTVEESNFKWGSDGETKLFVDFIRRIDVSDLGGRMVPRHVAFAIPCCVDMYRHHMAMSNSIPIANTTFYYIKTGQMDQLTVSRAC